MQFLNMKGKKKYFGLFNLDPYDSENNLIA